MSSKERNILNDRKRSLWCRVPKSRVILGSHRGAPNQLFRKATENSAKLSSTSTAYKERNLSSLRNVDQFEDLKISQELIHQSGCRFLCASAQGYWSKVHIRCHIILFVKLWNLLQSNFYFASFNSFNLRLKWVITFHQWNILSVHLSHLLLVVCIFYFYKNA